MFSTARKVFLFAAILGATALTGCLPEDKDPGKVTDAGKINGNYYASTLGNAALQVQNALVGDATWFTKTKSTALDLAAMGIDTNINGTLVKSHVCPTGAGTAVVQLTWVDGRDASGHFKVKGTGTDTGALVGALRERVSSEQVGTYNGSTNLQLGSGASVAIPASCAGVKIPLGAPVLAFRIEKPAAPVAEMARTEYRTVACPKDIRGIQKRGTQVQSRIVKYTADGKITPSNPNAGWSTDNLGTCVSDAIVTASSKTKTDAGSVALNNFADMAAQSLKDILENQLKMDCATVKITSDLVESGKQVKKGANIDTCTKVTASDSGKTIKDTTESREADSRDLCVEMGMVLSDKRFLGVSTGTLTSNFVGTAWVDRKVEKVALNDGSGNMGERASWVGRPAISCKANDSYETNCSKVPGQPTSQPLASNVGEKWEEKKYNVSEIDKGWFDDLFGICWLDCERVTGAGGKVINWKYFNSREVKHKASSTTTAVGSRTAKNWIDRFEKFTPNFQMGAFKVPGATNECLVKVRELQLTCPLAYTASKQSAYSLDNNDALDKDLMNMKDYKVTLIPGGIYGGEEGKLYRKVINTLGQTPGIVWLDWRRCDIKGCKNDTVKVGPGTDAYIKSWTYSDKSSISSATTTVQTIMMNKNGQVIDHRPDIISGPALRYQGTYSVPLRCGRFEKREFQWPVIVRYNDCGGKGGCTLKSYNAKTTVTETVTRSWSGDNSTNGKWTKPNTLFSTQYGTWKGSKSNIPNPIIVGP